jgi:preprotein translocase subunit SecG
MIYLFYTVHVLICFFLILVVLLQQGKGADLSVFGGGSTMTAFGARGAATLLHKMTVFSFVAFIVTTLAINILQGQREESSVMTTVEETEAAAEEPAAEETTEPAAALPAEEPESAPPAEESGATAEDAGAAAEETPAEDAGGGSQEP